MPKHKHSASGVKADLRSKKKELQHKHATKAYCMHQPMKHGECALLCETLCTSHRQQDQTVNTIHVVLSRDMSLSDAANRGGAKYICR